MRHPTLSRCALAALLLALSACSDTTNSTPPAAPRPAQLSIAEGDGQKALPGKALPGPLTVLVADSAGRPVPGAWVAWQIDSETGTLSTDSVRAGSDGRASVTWTLGPYIGSWTATARVGEVAPVVFHESADGPIHVVVADPQQDSKLDLDFSLRAKVTSEATVTEVRAAASFVDVALRPDFADGKGGWSGSMSFEGVPVGPHRLRMTARDADGNVAMAFITVVHDGPLRIRVLSPLLGPVAGLVTVRAVCEDDSPGSCRSFQGFARVGGTETLIGQANDAISATFSVANLTADSMQFVFRATDPSGTRTTVETPQLWVMPGPWTQVVAAPGLLIDASLDWALYTAIENSDFLKLLNVRTGEPRDLYAESSVNYLLNGSVTAAGAIIDFGQPNIGIKRQGVQEWGGSNGGDSRATMPRAGGPMAAYLSFLSATLHRDNVLTASLVHLDSMLVGDYDMADDGTIAFNGRRRCCSGRSQLFSWSGATVTQLTFDTAASAFGPRTDGSSFLFQQSTSTPAGFRYQLMYLGAGDPEPLTPLLAAPIPRDDTKINNGWAAFRYPDASGLPHTWARTPAGEVHEVWPGAPAGSSFLSLGPQGEVVFMSPDGMLYLSRSPHGTAVAIGRWNFVRGLKWFGGKLHVVRRGGLYRYDGP